MTKVKAPWAERWIDDGDEREAGGQGETRRIRDRATGEPGLLKRLKNNDSSERRARFQREAAVLATLVHGRVPRLLDSNASRYADPAIRLYMVQEAIPGRNLEKYISANGPIPAPVAIAMTLALLDVLVYCHEEGVGHRDVKPDNVVLRGDDPADPVLVDFGQAHRGDDADMATFDAQVMGNRFILLPEHGPGGSRRELRSDLTQLAGVLLYAVTGLIPGVLLDDQRLAPHARPEAAARLRDLDGGPLLSWILDRALRHSLVERFQTADEFRKALDYVRSGNVLPLEAILESTNHLLTTSVSIKARENFPKFHEALVEIAKVASKAVHSRMTGGRTHTVNTMLSAVDRATSGSFEYGLGVSEDPALRLVMIVTATHHEDRFRVEVAPRGSTASPLLCFECSVFAPQIPPDWGERLAMVLAREFARLIANGCA